MRSGPDTATVEWQFKKAGVPEMVTTEASDAARETSAPRIRCPKCRWQPDRSSTWLCWSGPGPEPPFESCGTAWHTFETGGRCPGCGHQWQWTTCLRCQEWSPHLDWYEDPQQEL